MRFLGIDPGQKRVGLALGDDESGFAAPHKTVLRESDAALLGVLVAECRAVEAEAIVMGLPVRMNGLEGPEARRARSFARALEQASGLVVSLWDERMTTMAAQRELNASGTRASKKKGLIDQAAATLLLQSFLDARSRRA